MPFLCAIAPHSTRGVLESNYGISGSSGSYFQLLSGMRPVLAYPIYQSACLSQIQALPSRLKKSNINSYAYHNNTNRFWNRGLAFQSFGVTSFDDISSIHKYTKSKWGLSDEDVVSHILSKQLKKTEPGLHFWITMSSHSPFNLVADGYNATFSYVDRQIKRLVENFPTDNTMFILYGDHPSPEHNKSWNSRNIHKQVPFLAFIRSQNSIRPIDSDFSKDKTYEIASLYYLVESSLLHSNISNDHIPKTH